jgi:AcrR family transcriptional regulator
MARTSKQDWLVAGLQILAEHGAPGLTIDRLTMALGLTKGSFYHHFQSLSGYRAALLDYIESKIAEQVAATAQAPSPAAGIAQLFDPLAAPAPALEVALRAWAWQDDEVRAVQARIDERRAQRAHSFCRQIAEDDEQAVLMSRLAQALMIGSTQVQPPLGPDLRRALFAEFVRLYQFDEATNHA